MQRKDFFKRLYSGFKAEYIVAGKIFGAGLEAFKLPADFGFDLLISNQMNKSFGEKSEINRIYDFPYVLQVKSRIIQASYFQEKNQRQEAVINFKITEDEFFLLSKEKSSYLALVLIFPEEKNTLSEKHAIVWFKGTQLPCLREQVFLEPVIENDRRFYEISVVIRLNRKEKAKEMLMQLVKNNDISEKVAKIIEEKIPAEYLSGNTNEYISIRRRSYTKDNYESKKAFVVCKVSDVQTAIENIGCEVFDISSDIRPAHLKLPNF
ncbi:MULTISPECIES: hypothetical protein [unclassified Delftia]|uniref:hypothetical protein n=1 Tax=unclassified Delftia TaxID=2613839 RepID=UPI00044655D9|nr:MULTISPECIES: hypothetical protein [unclassified Delftia]EZP51160.1 hypothetical protein BW39_04048 [Delftia sp. RIT313]